MPAVLPLSRSGDVLAAEAPAAGGQAPAAVLTTWMATASAGDLQPRLLRLADGRIVPLPVDRWAGPAGAGDDALLARATGPVLDVGCGPGRLTAALHSRGTDVLGVELLPDVPVLAREAGAPLLVGDVFDPVPREGQWQTVLLADGNVGIGGDAVRVLTRVGALLAPGGRVLCELHPDADTATCGPVRLEGLGAVSAWFPWALLDRAGLRAAAPAAGLAVVETWEADARSFASLAAL